MPMPPTAFLRPTNMSRRKREMAIAQEVADDGVGGTVGRRGSGLRELTDRIETLGGTLTVVSPVGAGTCLQARIPVPPELVG